MYWREKSLLLLGLKSGCPAHSQLFYDGTILAQCQVFHCYMAEVCKYLVNITSGYMWLVCGLFNDTVLAVEVIGHWMVLDEILIALNNFVIIWRENENIYTRPMGIINQGFRPDLIQICAKIRVYVTLTQSVLTYGGETWDYMWMRWKQNHSSRHKICKENRKLYLYELQDEFRRNEGIE
jgi:hypothetical protein